MCPAGESLWPAKIPVTLRKSVHWNDTQLEPQALTVTADTTEDLAEPQASDGAAAGPDDTATSAEQ